MCPLATRHDIPITVRRLSFSLDASEGTEGFTKTLPEAGKQSAGWISFLVELSSLEILCIVVWSVQTPYDALETVSPPIFVENTSFLFYRVRKRANFPKTHLPISLNTNWERSSISKISPQILAVFHGERWFSASMTAQKWLKKLGTSFTEPGLFFPFQRAQPLWKRSNSVGGVRFPKSLLEWTHFTLK